MRLSFSKMQGLGNDFVVLDNRTGNVPVGPDFALRLSDRRLGIGFDQMLIIERCDSAVADFGFRIVNADGSEVEHCGNGARCVARYARANGIVDRDRITMALPCGTIRAELLEHDRVTVDMGEPEFRPSLIPFDAPSRARFYTLNRSDGPIELGAVSMGNPHALVTVASVDAVDLEALGRRIQSDAHFTQGVNVGVAEVRSRTDIHLRVYERGVGETRACGTGACAAVAVLRDREAVDERVRVALPGGELEIVWPGEGASLWMSGDAQFVFRGEVEV